MVNRGGDHADGLTHSSFFHLRVTTVSAISRRRQGVRNWLIAGIGAVVLGATVTGGAIAFASSDGEGGVTGPQADRAVQAALAATGGGIANAVERDGESGGVWEVEVRKPDRAVVDVRLDGNYHVVVIEGDNEKADTNDSGA